MKRKIKDIYWDVIKMIIMLLFGDFLFLKLLNWSGYFMNF